MKRIYRRIGRITIISTSLIEGGCGSGCSYGIPGNSGSGQYPSGRRTLQPGRKAGMGVMSISLTWKKEREKRTGDVRSSLTRGLMQKYEDISAPDCIREYYDRLYFLNRDEIQKNTMHQSAKSASAHTFSNVCERV